MATYAVVDNSGVMVNTIISDGAPPPVEISEGLEPISYVGPIDGLNPIPQVGWTWNGTTWTPTAQSSAAQNTASFAASLPSHLAQAQADVVTIAAWQAGQAPNAAQIAVLNNWANGWVTLLQALQQLYNSLPS